MSTRNRQRRERNREARAAAEVAAIRRARRLRWGFAIGGLVIAAVVALVFVLDPFGDDGDDVAAEAPSTSTTVAPAATSDCVPVSGSVPEGAPDVPVKVGPPPTELLVEDLTVGDGAEVTAESNPSINYIGVACSTGAVFDESYSGGAPLQPDFDPATPGWEVIEGWKQGIPGMKVGGRRLLGIPPALAYGEAGSPPAIGPNETLWFVVEVVSV